MFVVSETALVGEAAVTLMNFTCVYLLFFFKAGFIVFQIYNCTSMKNKTSMDGSDRIKITILRALLVDMLGSRQNKIKIELFNKIF